MGVLRFGGRLLMRAKSMETLWKPGAGIGSVGLPGTKVVSAHAPSRANAAVVALAMRVLFP